MQNIRVRQVVRETSQAAADNQDTLVMRNSPGSRAYETELTELSDHCKQLLAVAKLHAHTTCSTAWWKPARAQGSSQTGHALGPRCERGRSGFAGQPKQHRLSRRSVCAVACSS